MTADRARGALAVLQDADGKFICEVPYGYIVEQTASAHKPRRIQAQRRRRAMLRRRVALTVALLTVAALLAALMPWSGSGAADKPKDTTAGTLEEVHQPTAVLLPSSGTAAEEPNAKLITWRLAKRATRDFLRVSFMPSAIVSAATHGGKTAVRVYGKY